MNSKEIVARLTPGIEALGWANESEVGNYETIMYLSSDTILLFRCCERGWVEVDRYQRTIKRHPHVFLDLRLQKM